MRRSVKKSIEKYLIKIALCLVVIFSSCVTKIEKGYVWKIVDVDFPDENSLNAELSHENCFLSITEEGTYTFYLNGYYSEGKIVESGKEFKMHRAVDNKLIASFEKKNEKRNEAILEFTLFDPGVIQKTSNSDEVSHSVELPEDLMKSNFSLDVEKEKRGISADPYAARHNRWRVKPINKESDKEIKARVKNHIAFMQLYFENALEIGLNTVSEPNLASPFEVFSNGVSMRKFEEIEDWQDLFFDMEDAKKGYDLIKNELKKNFTLLKTKNAFELNADIFRKLLKMID